MTIDAEKPLVNSSPAPGQPLSDKEIAQRMLAGARVRLKFAKDDQAFAELLPVVVSELAPAFHSWLLDQHEIRSGLLYAAGANDYRLALVDEQVPEPRTLVPQPYSFPDPAKIPPRPKIMGDDYVRGYVSATVAPGGIGKSSLVTAEILALVTGKRILGRKPRTPKRVWYIGEDDQDELNRRFAAAMKCYGISPYDVGDRLFVQSFRDHPLMIASQQGASTIVNVDDVRAVVRAARAIRADVIIADPLIKTHSLNENDNKAMDIAYTQWSDIAHRAKTAVHLIVHTRKAVAGQAASIEDIRGAGSQLGAVRSARLLVAMERGEAEALNIDPDTARLHIRIADTKANMVAQGAKSGWYKLNSVFLGNASTDPNADNVEQDNIQVVDLFTPPALFAGTEWHAIHTFMREIQANPARAHVNAKDDWAGHRLGELLDIDTSEKRGRARVTKMLDTWRQNKQIKIVLMKDGKRNERPCITVDQWDFSAS